MNVYQIGKLTIAAESPEKAYWQWLDYNNDFEELFALANLAEGEEETVEITVRRLTNYEINNLYVPCCVDGCDDCEDLNDHIYYSYQQLMDQKKKEDFPCVLSIEE